MPLNEKTSLILPNNPYGKSKQFIESILDEICNADAYFSAGVLRYFNPLGCHKSARIGEDPRLNNGNLGPALLSTLKSDKNAFSLFGDDYDTKDGSCIRDFIHVDDLAHGHVKALESINSKSGLSIWNLGTGEGHSVFEAIRAFEKASNSIIKIDIKNRRYGDQAISYACVDKAKDELDWNPEHSLDDMMTDLYRWHIRKGKN